MINPRHKDVNAYVNNIADVISNYIKHEDNFPPQSKLAIQPDVCAVVIDDPKACRNCDFYDLDPLIQKCKAGYRVPDIPAITQVVRAYVN